MSRLAAYRSLEGLSQDDLADVLEVPRQRISEVERGLRPPTFDLSPLGYSDERIAHLPDMSDPLHRHYTRTLKASKMRAKEIIRLAGEIYPSLLSDTRLKVCLTQEFSSGERDLDDIEELAADVRAVLRCEEDVPIQNLTGAVERAGVAIVPILERNADPDVRTIDGLSSWVSSADDAASQPVIGLDPNVPGERFRFSLAHELGHLVMHSRRHGYTEDEANRFAGALLVPRRSIEDAFEDVDTPTLSDFLNLKVKYGVSVAALIYRARDLNLITPERYRSMQIQKSTAWSRKHEPNDSPVNRPGLLAKMIERSGGVTAAASDLGVPEGHLNVLVQWSPPKSRDHLRVV